MDKEHHRASRKTQSQKTPETHHHADANRSPRSLPDSSDPAASAAIIKNKSPAPPRRSAATRQWIKSTTAPAGKPREDAGDIQMAR
jgi:hypothetical protein